MELNNPLSLSNYTLHKVIFKIRVINKYIKLSRMCYSTGAFNKSD
jgi:hypothetical protein